MKNNLTKFLASFLALALALVSLAACGKKDGKTDDITKPSGGIEGPSETLDSAVDFNDYTLPGDVVDTEDPTAGTDIPELDITGITDSNVTYPNDSTGGSGQTSDGLSQSDMISLLNAAGYEYDKEQDIYYTTLEPWQRHFGFTSEYDTAAGYVNMFYMTFKCDFTYGDKMWRIQCWKGQYALLSGAEMGVYTKDINSSLSDDFYACANNDNLLQMGFDFYKTMQDYNNHNKLFTRQLEYHWWQTGFKFGYCNPKTCVAVMTLYAKDTAMADGIEKGLKNVRNANGALNPFYKYGTNAAVNKGNIYKRDGNKFQILWTTAGYANYSGNLV